VRGDDLLGGIVELLAVLVEDEGVGIAVEDLKRELRGVFVVDLRKGLGEDGPRVVKVVVVQNTLRTR
jgi:hypothetical protein